MSSIYSQIGWWSSNQYLTSNDTTMAPTELTKASTEAHHRCTPSKQEATAPNAIQARNNCYKHHPSKKQLLRLHPSKKQWLRLHPSKKKWLQHDPNNKQLLRGWQWEIPVCKNAHRAHWFVLEKNFLNTFSQKEYLKGAAAVFLKRSPYIISSSDSRFIKQIRWQLPKFPLESGSSKQLLKKPQRVLNWLLRPKKQSLGNTTASEG